LFLQLAFGSQAFFVGQFIGKSEMIALGTLLTFGRRRLCRRQRSVVGGQHLERLKPARAYCAYLFVSGGSVTGRANVQQGLQIDRVRRRRSARRRRRRRGAGT